MNQTGLDLVVADAGPLIGLAKIGRLELLHRLFSRVLVPEAVAEELRLGSDLPGAAVLCAARDRGWLQVRAVPSASPRLLAVIDRGEAEAIALARSENARLLIDESCGRRAARKAGVPVFGTGAVLLMAKKVGLIPAVAPVSSELLAAHYRISAALRSELLRLANEPESNHSGAGRHRPE